VEGTSDETLEFAFGWQFQPECSATGIRAFTQILFGWGRRCPSRAEPRFKGLLVLPRREAEARVLPNEQQMAIVGRAVPRIIRGMVPQQVQLMRQESADNRGHLGECAGEVA